jgi:hypothetical protein
VLFEEDARNKKNIFCNFIVLQLLKLSATNTRTTAVKLKRRDCITRTHKKALKNLRHINIIIKCTQRETKYCQIFSIWCRGKNKASGMLAGLSSGQQSRASLGKFPPRYRGVAQFSGAEREVKLRFVCALKLKTVLSCVNAPPTAAPASGFPDTPSRGYDWAIKHGDGGERPLPTFPAFSLKFYGARRWLRAAIAKLIYSRSEIEP